MSPLGVEVVLATGARIVEHATAPAYLARALKRALQRAELSVRVGPPTSRAHTAERNVYDSVLSIVGVKVDFPGGRALVGGCINGIWRLVLVDGKAPRVVREFAAPGLPPRTGSHYARAKWLKESSDSYTVRANLLETMARLGAM